MIKSRKRYANAKNRILSWRCPKCQTFYSLYDNTFFEAFKKPLYDVLQIIKCWALELTIAKTIEFLKLENSESSRQTVGKIFKALRNICTLALDKSNSNSNSSNSILINSNYLNEY